MSKLANWRTCARKSNQTRQVEWGAGARSLVIVGPDLNLRAAAARRIMRRRLYFELSRPTFSCQVPAECWPESEVNWLQASERANKRMLRVELFESLHKVALFSSFVRKLPFEHSRPLFETREP